MSYREANENKTTIDPPQLNDPAFRALVEENVKDSVFNVITSPVMQQHWTAYIAQEQAQNTTSSSSARRRAQTDAPLKPAYVHGELTLGSGSHPPPEPIYRTWTRLTHTFGFFLPFSNRFCLRHCDWRRHRSRDFLRPAWTYFPGSSAGCRQACRRRTRSWPCSLVNLHTS